MATASLDKHAFTQDPGQHFRMSGVPWRAYEALLDAAGDSRVRITYDRGEMELVTLSPEHEIFKGLFARLIEVLAEECDRPIWSWGSTTFRREDLERGLEPDECFYLDNGPLVAGRRRIDLRTDPPPDLAVEIDITRRDLERESIYAALGVPELWRFDGSVLRISRLTGQGTYTLAQRSGYFPVVEPHELVGWVGRGLDLDMTSWRRLFRAWVREQIGRAGRQDGAGPA